MINYELPHGKNFVFKSEHSYSYNLVCRKLNLWQPLGNKHWMGHSPYFHGTLSQNREMINGNQIMKTPGKLRKDCLLQMTTWGHKESVRKGLILGAVLEISFIRWAPLGRCTLGLHPHKWFLLKIIGPLTRGSSFYEHWQYINDQETENLHSPGPTF